MSTLAYANLTQRREETPPPKDDPQAAPAVSSYVDAMAALVPAEVLTLHAVILTVTTEQKVVNGASTTTISDAQTLMYSFWGLIVISIGLYLVPKRNDLDKYDIIRAAIPPISFVAWTMLQRTTAFDAVCPDLAASPRSVIALFVAVILGVVAGFLTGPADAKVVPASKKKN